MYKKGQIGGQIFIYILAAIIIGLIGLLGYQAIANILNKTCQAEQINFATDIKRYVEKYNSPGSINIDDISAPCDYTTICFLDAQQIQGPDANLIKCTNNTLIEASGKAGNRQNIFISNPSRTIPIGFADIVGTSDPKTCTCITQRNKNFRIKFIGHGLKTEVLAG